MVYSGCHPGRRVSGNGPVAGRSASDSLEDSIEDSIWDPVFLCRPACVHTAFKPDSVHLLRFAEADLPPSHPDDEAPMRLLCR